MTNIIRNAATAILFAALSLSAACAFATDYYVDSQDGSDAAAGTSPQEAWKTLKRVSRAEEIKGGDVVHFRSGRVWRESLAPRSGEEGKPVVYTSYGDKTLDGATSVLGTPVVYTYDDGPKPSFWRSVSLSEENDWVKEGENLWATRPREVKTVGEPRKLDGSWSLHRENGAVASFERRDDVMTIRCEKPGTASNHIQWIYQPFSIRDGKPLRLSFEARATIPTTFFVSLMEPSSPWRSYGAVSGLGELTSEFQPCQLYLQPNRDADDARLTFYLGKLPEGETLEIKNLKFEEVQIDELDMTPDVGNIILDGTFAAFKRWTRDELKAQDDFFYNREDGRVWYYSEKNPATTRKSLEAAIMRHVIDLSGVHDAVFDGLDLRYGAAHGFGGSGNARCVIRRCDISWIGGGDQYREGGAGRRVRFGNGIEFWSSARDHVVEQCRLWEVYDAALTNQGSGTNEERNIVYRENLIWNCEYSFEYWNRDESSVTDNITFVHNVCLNAGYGWGHAQRPDPNGRCLMFYSNTAQTTNFVVKGNIFANATESLVRSDVEWKPEGPTLDGNVYWQEDESKPYVLWLKQKYGRDEFDEFQKASGQETHGKIKRVDFSTAALGAISSGMFKSER